MMATSTTRLVITMALAQTASCFLAPAALISPALRAITHTRGVGQGGLSLMPSLSLRSPVRQGASSLNMGWFSGPQITVSKIQVAVQCDTRGPSSLLGKMFDIADEADTETDEGLEELVSDVALAVLRCEQDWISGSATSVDVKNEDEGEDMFSEMSMKERAKIERETINLVAGRDKSKERSEESDINSIGKPTVAIVTIIVALEGKELPKVTDMKSMRKCLTMLGGSDVMGSSALLASEVMWTPEEPWEVLDKNDLYLEYPELMPL
mmetsp:Transcript_22799/g.33433  ORF Transcript_22799/g.33433 Transcript_22799/m.33433 type:complete len:267 (+) Transcript_22799:50-850(+)